MSNINEKLFNMNCSTLLTFMSIPTQDGIGYNAPYRESADSKSFYTCGPFFKDYSHDYNSSNVWGLALLLCNEDKKKAIALLFKAAGILMNPRLSKSAQKYISTREVVKKALDDALTQFPLSKAPQHIIDYVDKRLVSDELKKKFIYIPLGEGSKIIDSQTDSEVKIKWMLEGRLTFIITDQNDYPIKFIACNNSSIVDPKAFNPDKIKDQKYLKPAKKAKLLNDALYNYSALYNEKKLIYCEGLFDALSLQSLGYHAVSPITTCSAGPQVDSLIKANRYRAKNIPEGEFIICFDNDTSGIKKSKELATKIWASGIDVKLVQHLDSGRKIDINDLHVAGLDYQIKSMFDSAKLTSETFDFSEDEKFKAYNYCMNYGLYIGAGKLRKSIVENNKEAKELFKQLDNRRPCQDYYKDISISVKNGTYVVIYNKDVYAEGSQHYDTCTNGSNLINDIRAYQKNPDLELSVKNLLIPSQRPIWEITKKPNEKNAPEINLFKPSKALLQEPLKDAKLPPTYNLVLDNIADKESKEYFLNHMAYYVQTLTKPDTMIVLYGSVGIGKNALIKNLGYGIDGHFTPVGNKELDDKFNDYLLNCVILFDEISVTGSEDQKNRRKNYIKSLINREVTINAKFKDLNSTTINNYICFSSNESHPIDIEPNDRRFSIITGGHQKDLSDVSEYKYEYLEAERADFILYLLSREVDEEMVKKPLMNEAKKRIIEQSMNPTVYAISNWVNEYKCEGHEMKLSKVTNAINHARILTDSISTQSLTDILRKINIEVNDTGKEGKQKHCIGIKI